MVGPQDEKTPFVAYVFVRLCKHLMTSTKISSNAIFGPLKPVTIILLQSQNPWWWCVQVSLVSLELSWVAATAPGSPSASTGQAAARSAGRS